ncbi:hypothetical protein [Rhizobium sp. IMFF44]|uniref:hypothetical protein n=1 Tax=Rhizobium sp. IMFF44 TaxID=3342350 RepID=UPI0035B998E0
MTLVHNERTKLLANALDRASTACIAAGLIAPVVSAVNGAAALQVSWIAILSSIIWLFAAFTLRMAARHVLGRLKL